MPNATPAVAPRFRRLPAALLRAAAVAALLVLLLLLGAYDEAWFAGLTAGWQRGLAMVGVTSPLAAARHGVHPQITTRNLPAMLSYGLLYTGTCLAILRLLLPAPAWRRALAVYGAGFGVCAVLLLAGKLLGDATWAYRLGRRLIDFIVSPLPVMVLWPLLRRPYGGSVRG